jgi:hypothetical protein
MRIYRSVIFPFVLYGCETYFLILKEAHRGLRCEYLDPRGRKWQEAEEDCIMRSFKLVRFNKYYKDGHIKRDGMDLTLAGMKKVRGSYRRLI